jgi:hypothetical protein
MAHKAGFDIIEINDVSETLELDLYMAKPKEAPKIDFVRENLRLKLQQILGDYNNITIWGAGAKSGKYAALLDKDAPIKYVVDSSADKEGKYIGGINKMIVPPSQDIIDDSEVIVIFASSYNDEIIARLRNEFNYDRGIVHFKDGNALFEKSTIPLHLKNGCSRR